MENRTLLDLANRSVASINSSVFGENYVGEAFEIRITPPYGTFVICYNDLAFCTSEELELTDEGETPTIARQIITAFLSRVQNPIGAIKFEENIAGIDPETEELISGLNDYMQVMKDRIIQKAMAGKRGWTNMNTPQILIQIDDKLSRYRNRESGMDIDIANLCFINFMNRRKALATQENKLVSEVEKSTKEAKVSTVTPAIAKKIATLIPENETEIKEEEVLFNEEDYKHNDRLEIDDDVEESDDDLTITDSDLDDWN